MSIIMRNVLNIMIIVCVCLNWGCTEGAQKREVDSHTIQLSSLFSSSSSLPCVLSPKASTSKSSLHVVHRHGSCSGNIKSPDEDDIFRHDQERVNSIYSKLSNEVTDRVKPSQSTKLTAKSGLALGAASYIVTIGIGTPKRDLSLIFDTGSDLMWIQCKPCAKSCYRQIEPIFDPSSSSSYSNVACQSPVCASLRSEGKASDCMVSNCGYKIGYEDNSSTQGILAKERLTLAASNVFNGVNFGCGQDNHGVRGVAGLLGLGRGKFSFPSQTATTYNNTFSYCLPSSGKFTGHLTFGSAGISKSIKYTPFSEVSKKSSLFGIDIVGISVDGKDLKIPSTVFSPLGCVIDSGTTITYLPPKAYEALRLAFKEKMSNYTATVGRSQFDTCYNFTGVSTARIPKISFAFNGGTVVDLDPVGVLYYYGGRSRVCLAFAANTIDLYPTIFGSVQQKTMQVVYDGPGNRIGFAPNGCN